MNKGDTVMNWRWRGAAEIIRDIIYCREGSTVIFESGGFWRGSDLTIIPADPSLPTRKQLRAKTPS